MTASLKIDHHGLDSFVAVTRGSPALSLVGPCCNNWYDMFFEAGAHSSLILFLKSSGSSVGGMRISNPTSASEGCMFITKPVGVGTPAFIYTGFTEITSDAALAPAFTKSNWVSLNLAAISTHSTKFSMAEPSNILDPCPGAPTACTTSFQGERSA